MLSLTGLVPDVDSAIRFEHRRQYWTTGLRDAWSLRPGPSPDALPAQPAQRSVWFAQRILVRRHERALLFRDGDFQQFLVPGMYRFPAWRSRYRIERFDVTRPAFEHRLADYLTETVPADIERLFNVVETGENETAVVYYNARVAAVLGPAERRLYWKGAVETRVERYDLKAGPALDERIARLLVADDEAHKRGIADRAVFTASVPEGHVGLLYVNGAIEDTLTAGLHAFWRFGRSIRVDVVDLRMRTLEIGNQEVLTRDNVPISIAVTVTCRIVDAATASRTLTAPLDILRDEIRWGVRKAFGVRNLETALEEKTAVTREVAADLRERFGELGIAIAYVRIVEIVVPGSVRSLLEKAKVLENNAVALRLLELETFERVAGTIGHLSVSGGLDAMLQRLVGPDR